MNDVYNTMHRNEIIKDIDRIIDNLHKHRTSSKKYFKEYSNALEAFVDGNKILKAMTKEGKITTSAVEKVNVGSIWTKDEERLLLEEFEGGTDIEYISSKLGRTVEAIKLRLIKLNRIKPSKKLADKYS